MIIAAVAAWPVANPAFVAFNMYSLPCIFESDAPASDGLTASPGAVPMEAYPARCLCRLSDAKVIDCYTVRNVLLGGNPHASDIAGLPDAVPATARVLLLAFAWQRIA